MLLLLLILLGVGPLAGASLSMHHEAQLSIDFSGQRSPLWSGGSLIAIADNQTSAPSVTSLDSQGRTVASFNFSIPNADLVDIDGWAGGKNNEIALCGSASDRDGRASGFLALVNKNGAGARIFQVFPYTPYRIALANDGTMWAAGLELIDGKETGPGIDLQHGVLRHFDRSGKLIESFVPRTSLPSLVNVTWGWISTSGDRVGWYTGPIFGPGSEYYEISGSRGIAKGPALPLGDQARVTGMALAGDGRTYVTIQDKVAKRFQLRSLGAGESKWRVEVLPSSLAPRHWLELYGAEGNELVLWRDDNSKMVFAGISP